MGNCGNMSGDSGDYMDWGIHSLFKKNLLIICYMQDTVPDTGNKMMNKADMVLAFMN